MADGKDKDGVWRTICGRRIFIRKGQSLTDAMRKSGKVDGKVEKSEKLEKGFIKVQLFGVDYSSKTDKQLNKSRKSHQKQIEKHDFKLKHPEKFYKNWGEMPLQEKNGRLKQWQKEIKNFKNQIKFIDKEFEKRGHHNED